MSGPKAADVRPKLRRAVEEIQRQVNQAQSTAERLSKMDSVNLNECLTEANGIAGSLQAKEVTAAMNKYASEEVASLSSQRSEMEAQYKRARSEQAQAEALLNESRQLHASAEQRLQNAVRAAESALAGLNSNSTGWYLYEEQEQANQARADASEALRMERRAGDKVREALEHKKKAKSAFENANKLGRQYIKRFDSACKVAADLENAARIAEENERQAKSSKSAIESALNSIQGLNHAKFAAGELARLEGPVKQFNEAFVRGDYAVASRIGAPLAKDLQALDEKVIQLQNAFEAALLSAQNSLKAAREETSVLNQAELAKWTGNEQGVNTAFDALSQAETLIGAERFAEAESLLASNLAAIRDFAKLAEERSNAANQRMELAEVIMNALYEQGYDSPTFYYSEQNQAGEDVEYSDLTIFAKAPGVRGDMRMNINLEGKVKLEVEGIAEGEETACHKLITDLQSSMNEEIDFEMTDWGRATGVDSQAKIAMREQAKEQEKTRERQHGK